MQMAANAELRAAALRWLGVGDSASADAALRDEMFLRATLRMYENQYHQNRDGTFDDAVWVGYVANMRRVFIQPSFRAWWPEFRVLFSPDFADFVESVMQSGPDESRDARPGRPA